MSEDDTTLTNLAISFALMSFFAIGGINPVIPEMHRQAVEVYGWISSERFTDLFAIAQAAPGPNIIVVTLIGWEVARFPGALVATAAIVTPTSILTFAVGHTWERFRHARWRIAVQTGFGPIAIGLVASSAFILAVAADTSIVAFLITFVTAIVLYKTRTHPLVMLLLGGLLGLFGLV